MNCPNCGHATPPTDAARCGHCNFKLPANPQPQAAPLAAAVPCWNCRHPNATEAERCEYCNVKLRAAAFGKTNSTPERSSFAARNPVAPQPRIYQLSNISSHDE